MLLIINRLMQTIVVIKCILEQWLKFARIHSKIIKTNTVVHLKKGDFYNFRQKSIFSLQGWFLVTSSLFLKNKITKYF